MLPEPKILPCFTVVTIVTVKIVHSWELFQQQQIIAFTETFENTADPVLVLKQKRLKRWRLPSVAYMKSCDNAFSGAVVWMPKYAEFLTSPYSLVGQPAGITVVISISKGSLQLAWCCDDRWVLHTHSLGVSEGKGVAVMRGPVVKYHTWSRGDTAMWYQVGRIRQKLIAWILRPATSGSKKYLRTATLKH